MPSQSSKVVSRDPSRGEAVTALERLDTVIAEMVKHDANFGPAFSSRWLAELRAMREAYGKTWIMVEDDAP